MVPHETNYQRDNNEHYSWVTIARLERTTFKWLSQLSSQEAILLSKMKFTTSHINVMNVKSKLILFFNFMSMYDLIRLRKFSYRMKLNHLMKMKKHQRNYQCMWGNLQNRVIYQHFKNWDFCRVIVLTDNNIYSLIFHHVTAVWISELEKACIKKFCLCFENSRKISKCFKFHVTHDFPAKSMTVKIEAPNQIFIRKINFP